MSSPIVPRRFAAASKQLQLGSGITVELYQPQSHAQLPAHDHLLPCLNLVLEGGIVETRGVEPAIELRAGALSLLPAGLSHGIVVGARPANVLHVEFAEHFIRRLPLSYRSPLPSLVLHDQNTHALACRFRQEMQCSDSLSTLAFEGLAIEALMYLLRQSENQRPGLPDWLERCVRHWQADPARPVRIQELAAQLQLSPGALARIFKRHFGQGIGDYLAELRITASCTALRGGTVALATLATRMGFADQSHFTRVFRRIMGMTPSAYRTQQRAVGDGQL